MKPALSTVLGVMTLTLLIGGPFVAVMLQPTANQPQTVTQSNAPLTAFDADGIIHTSQSTPRLEPVSNAPNSALGLLRTAVAKRSPALESVFVGYEETSSIEHILDGSETNRRLRDRSASDAAYHNTGSFSMSFCRTNGDAKFCKTE